MSKLFVWKDIQTIKSNEWRYCILSTGTLFVRIGTWSQIKLRKYIWRQYVMWHCLVYISYFCNVTEVISTWILKERPTWVYHVSRVKEYMLRDTVPRLVCRNMLCVWLVMWYCFTYILWSKSLSFTCPLLAYLHISIIICLTKWPKLFTYSMFNYIFLPWLVYNKITVQRGGILISYRLYLDTFLYYMNLCALLWYIRGGVAV